MRIGSTEPSACNKGLPLTEPEGGREPQWHIMAQGRQLRDQIWSVP